MHRRQISFVSCLLFTLWLVQSVYATPPAPPASSPSRETEPAAQVAVMRQAVQYALNLEFTHAFSQVTQLDVEEQPTLTSQLTEGLVAYFQYRWDPEHAAAARKQSHAALTAVLEDGQKQLSKDPDSPWLPLLLGTAAIFDALLQETVTPWQSQQLFARGRTWLQDLLIAHDTVPDAHLGLGLLYFASSSLPGPLRFLPRTTMQRGSSDAIHHLRQAITHGTFSQDIARTFLAQLYEEEQRHEDAVALGQTLQQAFPMNGSYALLTGRNQCAQRRYDACTATLGQLEAHLSASQAILAQRDDRFDLYYLWGTALNERREYESAFRVLRRAINQDVRASKDDTLWAKYHLARLYERRGQAKTAAQIYHTLLRGRNVDDLHERATQRLTHLR